jgi:hypothetical protein
VVVEQHLAEHVGLDLELVLLGVPARARARELVGAAAELVGRVALVVAVDQLTGLLERLDAARQKPPQRVAAGVPRPAGQQVVGGVLAHWRRVRPEPRRAQGLVPTGRSADEPRAHV